MAHMTSSSLPLQDLVKIKVGILISPYKNITMSIYLLFYIPTGNLEPGGSKYEGFQGSGGPPLKHSGAELKEILKI